MKYKLLVAGMATFLALASSCMPAQSRTPDSVNRPVAGITATHIVTATPARVIPTGTPVVTETQQISEPEKDVAGRDITFAVHMEKGIKPYLVDDRGRSLYVYMNDSQNSGLSACTDDCSVEWPPLIVSEMPAAGNGVDSDLVGTISRDDGSTQATYNGWPLYYYNMDTIPGTVYGQTYERVWFLLSPAGEPLRKLEY